MTAPYPRVPLRVLMLIAGPALAEKAQNIYRQMQVPIALRMHANGTATNEVMDLLGLGTGEKTLLLCVVSRSFSIVLLDALREGLYLGSPNTGIAFTVPVTGAALTLLRAAAEGDNQVPLQEEKQTMSDLPYALIATVVDRGFTDDVMQAARSAGAYGGTVLHGRDLPNEEVVQNFHLSLNDEKEIVLILTEKAKKMAIMQAISTKCGLNSEAKGLVLSLPIDSLAGLKRPYRVQKAAEEEPARPEEAKPSPAEADTPDASLSALPEEASAAEEDAAADASAAEKPTPAEETR